MGQTTHAISGTGTLRRYRAAGGPRLLLAIRSWATWNFFARVGTIDRNTIFSLSPRSGHHRRYVTPRRRRRQTPSRFERDHPRRPTVGNLHTRRLAWRGERDRRKHEPRWDGSRRNGEALKCARDQRRDRIGSGEIGSAHTLRRALAHSAIRRAAGGL